MTDQEIVHTHKDCINQLSEHMAENQRLRAKVKELESLQVYTITEMANGITAQRDRYKEALKIKVFSLKLLRDDLETIDPTMTGPIGRIDMMIASAEKILEGKDEQD